MDNSKPPFDEKKLDAGEGPAESPGSVTSMFSTPAGVQKNTTSTDDLLAELLRPKIPSPAPPVQEKPAAPILEKPVVPIVAMPAAPPTAPKSESGEVTRMLEQLRPPLARASAPAHQATPPVFTPPPAPVFTPPVAAAPLVPAAEPGEVTRNGRATQRAPTGQRRVIYDPPTRSRTAD